MKLSKNFSLREMTASQTAERMGIDNYPTVVQIARLKQLCENILQPLRDHVGFPVIISSGFRSEALNTHIGGSAKSQHCKGQAVDIDNGDDVQNIDIFGFIRRNCSFDQVIWEFGSDTAPSWIHVSYKSEDSNRNQVLRARKVAGKTVYTEM